MPGDRAAASAAGAQSTGLEVWGHCSGPRRLAVCRSVQWVGGVRDSLRDSLRDSVRDSLRGGAGRCWKAWRCRIWGWLSQVNGDLKGGGKKITGKKLWRWRRWKHLGCWVTKKILGGDFGDGELSREWRIWGSAEWQKTGLGSARGTAGECEHCGEQIENFPSLYGLCFRLFKIGKNEDRKVGCGEDKGLPGLKWPWEKYEYSIPISIYRWNRSFPPGNIHICNKCQTHHRCRPPTAKYNKLNLNPARPGGS